MASPRDLLLLCLVGRPILGSRVRVSDSDLAIESISAQGEKKLSNACSEWPNLGGTSREAFMAHMAIGIYADVDIRKDQVGDWKLELIGDTSHGQDKQFGGRDYFGIYRKGQECVLTIAGSSNAEDWKNNIQFKHYGMPYCGIADIHYGFFSQWSDTIWSGIWDKKFVPFFDDKCTDGISVVGHSLAGAVAAVMATCSHSTVDKPTHNASSKMTRQMTIPWKDKDNQTQFSQTSLPIISELWTFGAPGISKNQTTNQSAEDGVFKGKRFFIDDTWVFDPVPYSSHLTELVHPKMMAVNLYQDGDNCTEEHWNPDTEEAKLAPQTLKIPDANKHSYSYEPRVVDAFG